MICPFCNKEIADNSDFCPICGGSVVSRNQEISTSESENIWKIPDRPSSSSTNSMPEPPPPMMSRSHLTAPPSPPQPEQYESKSARAMEKEVLYNQMKEIIEERNKRKKMLPWIISAAVVAILAIVVLLVLVIGQGNATADDSSLDTGADENTSISHKASIATDTQTARNMNMILTAEDCDTINEVIDALDANGYNTKKSLTPITMGYSFVWIGGEYDTIVLVDESGKLVSAGDDNLTDKVYAALADDIKIDLRYISTLVVTDPTSADELVSALSEGVRNINLADDVVVDAEVVIPAGANVTLNLGGHKCSTTALNAGTTAQTSKYIKVSEGASLTIENGTFEGRGIMNYGELTVKAGTVINSVDKNGGGCIRNKSGAKVTIEGGEFNVPNYAPLDGSNNGGAAGVHNDSGEVIINGGTFTSNTDTYLIHNVNGGRMTINGGTFTAFRGALYAVSGEIIINGGDFKVTNDSNSGWVVCHEGTGSITLNGGTFESVTTRVFYGNVIDKRNSYASNTDALSSALVDGKTVYLNNDFAASDGITPEGAGDFELDLNGNTITAGADIGAWAEGQNFVVSNGVIDATESEDNTAVYAGVGATVELNNVQIYGASGMNPIQCYGGTMVLDNVITVQDGNADISCYNSAIQVINEIVKNAETGKWAITSQANLTVEGGMYSGDKAIQISAPGGNVTINGGTFTGTTYVIQDDFAPQYYTDGANYESKIVINDGNFNGNIKITAATVLEINGGTFVCNDATAELIKAHVTAGKTVTINGVEFTK